MPAMLIKLARVTAALLLASTVTVPVTGIAQTSPPSPVCMARPGNDPESPTFVAVVPASEQTNMKDRGYSPRACLVDSSELAAYRSKVCHLANDVPAVVQGQFEQQYNISPRALCDMANTLAGA